MASIPRKPRPGSEISNSRTPSTPSSAQQTPPRNGVARPKKKLKSQYPADSTELHVEYILVASFHVDQGPIMEHQYPSAISGDENMLAELMLPDQAHNRKEDWTIFFLHKDGDEDLVDEEELEQKDQAALEENESGPQSDLAAVSDKASRPEAKHKDDEDDTQGGEGPPLIYVLNLVNTKHDPSAKRFA